MENPHRLGDRPALSLSLSLCSVAVPPWSKQQATSLTDTRTHTGIESVPKIITNDTINAFLNGNQHFGNFKP